MFENEVKESGIYFKRQTIGYLADDEKIYILDFAYYLFIFVDSYSLKKFECI